jgi:hypothetical protein
VGAARLRVSANQGKPSVASFPMSNPQAAAPQPGDAAASAQANPLQTVLGRMAMIARQLGTQNTVIQAEMEQATTALVQALQKVSQAAPSAPQQPPAPPQQ